MGVDVHPFSPAAWCMIIAMERPRDRPGLRSYLAWAEQEAAWARTRLRESDSPIETPNLAAWVLEELSIVPASRDELLRRGANVITRGHELTPRAVTGSLVMLAKRGWITSERGVYTATPSGLDQIRLRRRVVDELACGALGIPQIRERLGGVYDEQEISYALQSLEQSRRVGRYRGSCRLLPSAA